VVGQVFDTVRQRCTIDVEVTSVLVRTLVGRILGVEGHVELCA
jgi:hypothetical protein